MKHLNLFLAIDTCTCMTMYHKFLLQGIWRKYYHWQTGSKKLWGQDWIWFWGDLIDYSTKFQKSHLSGYNFLLSNTLQSDIKSSWKFNINYKTVVCFLFKLLFFLILETGRLECCSKPITRYEKHKCRSLWVIKIFLPLTLYFFVKFALIRIDEEYSCFIILYFKSRLRNYHTIFFDQFCKLHVVLMCIFNCLFSR